MTSTVCKKYRPLFHPIRQIYIRWNTIYFRLFITYSCSIVLQYNIPKSVELLVYSKIIIELIFSALGQFWVWRSQRTPQIVIYHSMGSIGCRTWTVSDKTNDPPVLMTIWTNMTLQLVSVHCVVGSKQLGYETVLYHYHHNCPWQDVHCCTKASTKDLGSITASFTNLN